MLIKLAKNIDIVTTFKDVFSAQECAALINFEWEKIDNPDYLNKYSWFLDKLISLIYQANIFYYQFDINDLQDIHIQRFSPSDFFSEKWQIDITDDENTSVRKITFLLFLSKETDYKGGKLSFASYNEDYLQMQGTVILFPAYKPHDFSQVTSGSDFVIKGWACGPHFR
jgi:hypothetical protein